jgi:CubicO group peptidase (beta-lactamase class C family)
MKPFAISAILACICLFTNLNAQSTKLLNQEVIAEAGIQKIMQEEKVVGFSVAVVKNNKIIYTHSFGMQDIEKNIPLTDNAIFRIASISKSFTATSIMQLVEAGKLSLDDDFSNQVGFTVRNPKFPNTVITLRMVLSHTSSINDSEGYFTLDAINPSKNPNFAKCYNNYEPGKGYAYCNLNYNMTGAVIEKITGERFDQYVKHHILDPLGIYGGYCVDSLDKSRFATLYEYNKDSAKFVASPAAYNPRSEEIKNHTIGYTTPIFSPTGGMKISATDLAKYMIMHARNGKFKGGRIISKKSSIEMQTKLSDDENYGLALETTSKLIAGETMCGHTGSAYGLYSAMFFNVKRKMGIVVICNGCGSSFDSGFNSVIKLTVNTLYDAFIK